MTRMTRPQTLCLPLAVLMFGIAMVGCGPDPQLKIQDLTAENEQLRTDLADRDRQLNDALVRENDARESIDDLNRELAMMRANRNDIKKAGDWVSTPSFDMISISDSVLFASGKANLSRSGRSKLSQVANDIRSRYGDRDIWVLGHTDAQPIRKSKWKDNLQLGGERSAMVVRSLRDLGIPSTQLIAASCGEFRPIVTGGTSKNQARNRRVEIYAVRAGTTITDTTAARGYMDD